MVLIGLLRRRVLLGAKLDDCPSCGQIGQHLILRQTRWLSLFWIPVLLLWVSHVLVCSGCGATSKLSWRQAWQASRTRRLPLDRPRSHFAAMRLEDPYSIPADPATLFDPVQPQPGRSWFNLYTKAWPVLLVLVVASVVLAPRGAATSASGAIGPETGRGWDTLAVGDCYNLSTVTGATVPPLPTGATTGGADVTKVACTSQHAFEMYGGMRDISTNEAPFPGSEAEGRYADQQCTGLFTGYVGIPLDASPFSTQYIFPSADTWAHGDREIKCSLYDPSTTNVVVSQKATWVRYHSDLSGYSVSYPAGWSALRDAYEVVLSGPPAAVKVLADQMRHPSAEALLTLDKADLAKQGDSIDGTDTYRHDGLDWAVALYHSKIGDTFGVDAALVSGASNFLVSWSSPAGREQSDAGEFGRILASFSLDHP